LDPNVPPKKRAITCTRPKPLIPPPALLESRPEATFLPNPPESRLEAIIPPPNPPKSRLRATIPPHNLPKPHSKATISLPNPPESCLRATIPPYNPPESRLETHILPLNPLESRLETLIHVPPRPPTHPQTLGFLLANQWQFIQNFNAAIDKVKIETCIWCKEHWFSMDLKDKICHACFLRDKGNKTPFLMSAKNEITPGELLAHLLELTQIEKMIIA
jgi:hypothetical protein